MSTPEAFSPQGDPAKLAAAYDGSDAARQRIGVTLRRVAGGYDMPTDLQFVPGHDELLVVLEKDGTAKWVNLLTRRSGQLLAVDATKDSEQGLLGLAFHPKFGDNGLLVVSYTTRAHGRDVSRIELWQSRLADGRLAKAERRRTVLEVDQPYANHNGGQIRFDGAGYLLIAFGDGGWRGDPHGNGQNLNTLLAKILRIDVDHPAGGKAYGIPADNPFAKGGGAPEVYAYGLRNPWRFSIDGRGRLIVGDVGQELWEEVSVVERGGNYGWGNLEGRHCLALDGPPKKCTAEGTVLPIYEYPHGEDGRSVTGGYVYEASRLPALKGKYVFGDFISGRLWALDLPDKVTSDTRVTTVYTLGRWPILPATFGRNGGGDVFVADFSSGDVFIIAPR